MICISIGNIGIESALTLARDSQMIEIRQDLARFTFPEIASLTRTANRSIITCRPGFLSDDERLDLFSFALEHGASYGDVEMESNEAFLDKIKDLTLKYNHDLIISYHNYEKTPSAGELESVLESCYLRGATVAKIATMVNDDKDIANLLGLYRKKGRKVILGMGDKGLITRVASIPLGAEFTFASSSAGEATAPGQLTVKELTEIYNILKIN